MWKLISAKTQRATPSLAKEFVEMDAAPHDRPLSERRLQIYQKLAAAGQFRPCTWAKAECIETGGIYRINGKHTSILFSGLSPMPELFVTIENYQCETIEDVGRLYATFDNKLSSRTSSDINASFAAVVPELKDISRRMINIIVTGLSVEKWGVLYWHTQPQERAERLLDNPEFVIWANSILCGDRGESKEYKHIHRGGVAAAMAITYAKSKKAATEFWTAVRDETGPRPETPDRKIARWLRDIRVNVAPGAVASRKAALREILVRCLYAWNAFRRGDDVQIIRYSEQVKIPAAQ